MLGDKKLYKHGRCSLGDQGKADGAGLPGTPQEGLNAPCLLKKCSRLYSRAQPGKKTEWVHFLQINRVFKKNLKYLAQCLVHNRHSRDGTF